MVLCPQCESDMDIEEDEVDEGEVVSCPECGTEFEVIDADPRRVRRLRIRNIPKREDDDG